MPFGTLANRIVPHVRLKTPKISFHRVDPRQQPGPQARVIAYCAAHCVRRRASLRGVFTDPLDDVLMFSHGRECAIRHTGKQVPNDTLRQMPLGTLSDGMADDFRTALIWHMDVEGTKISDLVRETGVSRDVINKLLGRENSSTSAENAMLIAAYYGKTVNQFVARVPVDADDRLRTLYGLLRPEERRILEAQMRGLVSQRAS